MGYKNYPGKINDKKEEEKAEKEKSIVCSGYKCRPARPARNLVSNYPGN